MDSNLKVMKKFMSGLFDFFNNSFMIILLWMILSVLYVSYCTEGPIRIGVYQWQR